MMRGSLKTEGVVLGKKVLIDNTLIISLFSKEIGKVRVFAKGVRKIISRRLPAIQTGNLVKLVVYQKNNFYYLREVKLISAFSKIKEGERKYNHLYSFLFILDRLLADGQEEKKIYRLIKLFLITLSKDDGFNSENLNEYFNKILKLLGYSKSNSSYEKNLRIIESIINEKMPSFRL